MPKANPLPMIAKKLASLQAKSAKVNEELKAIAGIVDAEMKKQAEAPAPAKASPVKASGKTIAKATLVNSVKTIAATKKKGRPAKK